MQLGHKLRYLAEWTCTITCGFLLFCDTFLLVIGGIIPEFYGLMRLGRSEDRRTAYSGWDLHG